MGNLHSYTLILWLEYIPTYQYTEIFKNCVYTLYVISHCNCIHMSFEMVVFIFILNHLYIFFKYFQNLCLLLNCLNYINYVTQTQNFSEFNVWSCFGSFLIVEFCLIFSSQQSFYLQHLYLHLDQLFAFTISLCFTCCDLGK